jgi:hypothetical protein
MPRHDPGRSRLESINKRTWPNVSALKRNGIGFDSTRLRNKAKYFHQQLETAMGIMKSQSRR